ncbi:DNA alkylation repair enzyme [gut metagenome]|uniref:DNA alkylation repair enzyme n=1 Tax=gut metagenome TaxID=749906 RepID=J9FIN3_9ZZZZ
MEIRDEIRNKLHTWTDARYREFLSGLIPNTPHILGVRTPWLRQLAKELARDSRWRNFVEATDTLYYEETLLQGLVIGQLKMNWEEKKNYIQQFVPHINNWAVCDIFCGELKKTARKAPEAMWTFLQPYLTSKKEFEQRFGIVMLLHFVDEKHLPTLFAYADTFCEEGYYARMALAWVLSVCYIHFPKQTLVYLQHSRLDQWTYNKTLQKSIESLRVSAADKNILRGMKRK